MRKFFILMMIVAAALAGQPARAQQINKLSASTQMFLDEQAGRITLDATEQQVQERAKVKGISVAEAKRQAKWDRPIAAPVMMDGKKYISAFVRVTDAAARAQLEALGVQIECEFLGGTLFTTLIPVDQIEAVAAIASVSRVSVATKKRPLTDAARQYSNVDDVLNHTADAISAGLPTSYDGTGVVLGVIDTGIDFQHKAFKDASGNFRIKRAYVYNGSSAREYGDGASYSLTSSAPTTDDSAEDHGTHTSSTAGGSSVTISGTTTTVTTNHANATYGGMAPGADLYLAGINGLNDTYLANAFQKICSYADGQGKPVVVSNSWGSQFGPHDGTGEFADIINQYFGDSHPNHICLFAASNDAGTNGFSVSGTATSSSPLGTIIRWNTDYISYYYKAIASAWSRSTGVTLACKIIVINSSGTKQTEVTVNPSTNGTTVSGLSSYVSSGSLYAYKDYVGGSNKSQILLYTSGLRMKSGYYLAVQFYPTSGSTIVDVWSASGYTYFTNSPSTSGYTWTKGTDDMCVSDEATYANSIAVGAYSTKRVVKDYNNTSHTLSDYTLGEIAPFSSYATAAKSPTGMAYPWICAPGATIVSAVNHYDTNGDYSYINGNSAYYGMYRVNSDTSNPYGSMEGTSMATPAAAGIVALWLQAAKSVGKDLTVNDVKEIMKETAIKDSYVTTGSNRTHFGNGKIDALAGIKYILGDATPTPTITADPTSLTFAGVIGQTYTKTVTVTGTNLEGNITIAKSGNAAYTIDKTSITRGSDGKASATVTVTYKPTTTGNTTATLTLTSSNAENVTVSITGTATAPTITATPANVTFSCETGETRTQVITVKGTNLSGAVTATLSGGNGYYSIDKTSIAAATANSTNGGTITVTYKPTVAGNTSATLTLTSSNASNVTVNISGTATTPVPTIITSTQSVGFGTSFTNVDNTQSFNVSGKNLTGNITATLTDQNGVFALNTTTITAAEAAQGKAITVTFNPKAAQTYNGSIRLTSNGATAVTINLNGTGELQKVVPVMQPADTNHVYFNSFRADWTDETPADNVASYTLWVNRYVQPQYTLLLEETFAKCTRETTQSIANSLNNYMDNVGWTGYRVYQTVGGVRLGSGQGSGYITSPALNLSEGTGKISVVFTAKPYNTDTNVNVKITCGDATQTITVNSEAEQTIVLDAEQAANQKVQIATTASRKRIIITALKIYDGDVTAQNAPARVAAEQGDSTMRTITGITDRFYTVSDLTGGGTFDYKVKAIYADNTESDWSNVERVTLVNRPHAGLLGDVNLDGTVDVQDVNILVAIVLGKDSADNYDRRAYINDDDVVDVQDVNLVISIMLGKSAE